MPFTDPTPQAPGPVPPDPGPSPLDGRRTRKTGEHHRDGKYYRFTGGTVLVIRPWPDLRAWRKTPAATAWQRVRPDLHLDRVEPIGSDRTPRRQSLPRDRRGWIAVPRGSAGNSGLPAGSEPGGAVIDTDTPAGAKAETAPDIDIDVDIDVDNRPDIPESGPQERPLGTTLRWRGDWPVWRLERHLEGLKARHWLVSTFPGPIRRRLAAFPNRHWHLAVLMARCPASVDLVDGNPALAYALASSWCFRTHPVASPLRSARALLKQPQRRLLGWLGFPASASAVRILRKVPPAACTLPILLRLRDLMKDPGTLGVLRHARVIRGTLVRLLDDPVLRPMLTPRLLAELDASATPDRVHPALDLLHDTLRMRQQERLDGAVRFQSLAALRRHHDALVATLNERRELEEVHAEALRDVGQPPPPETPFPSPPIPGNSSIEPLTSAEALWDEGRAMDHCAGSHVPRVLSGWSYLYRVLSPTRATLSLDATEAGWRLGQLHGPSNTPVPPETLAAVHRWLGRWSP